MIICKCSPVLLLNCFTCFSQTSNGLLPLGLVDSVYSDILQETRYLNVYLPPDYQPDSAANYQAVFLLDGGMDEDFVHVAGLVQYLNFPWIQCYPRLILIGIENTNRKRDFTYPVKSYQFLHDMGYDTTVNPGYGGSTKFMDFIEKELQPYVRQKYPATMGTCLIGQSLGGLFAAEILLKRHKLFTHYIIVSPSLWWDNRTLLLHYSQSNYPVFSWVLSHVYLAVGDEGSDMIEPAKALTKILKSRKITFEVKYEFLRGHDHSNSLHLAVYNAFRLFYSK